MVKNFLIMLKSLQQMHLWKYDAPKIAIQRTTETTGNLFDSKNTYKALKYITLK